MDPPLTLSYTLDQTTIYTPQNLPLIKLSRQERSSLDGALALYLQVVAAAQECFVWSAGAGTDPVGLSSPLSWLPTAKREGRERIRFPCSVSSLDRRGRFNILTRVSVIDHLFGSFSLVIQRKSEKP